MNINEGRVLLDCIWPAAKEQRRALIKSSLTIEIIILFLILLYFVLEKNGAITFSFKIANSLKLKIFGISKLFTFVSALNQDSNISSAFTFTLSLYAIAFSIHRSEIQLTDKSFFFF